MARSSWTSLQAGPVQAWLVDGELRYVRVGETELLRRVYVAVRDRWWRTIPARVGAVRMKRAARSFQVTFDVSHSEGEIDFVWAGKITGDASGQIVFEMDGRALSDFWRNRIGLCVLHADTCAGLDCTIEEPDGQIVRASFPTWIAPHQPCKNIRAITHEPAPGLQVEVRLDGDVFEMEDQRNWTDGSFKTYSTPLSLPFPVEVKNGDRIAQSLTLNVRGAQRSFEEEEARPVAVTLGAVAGRAPQLGLGASSGQRELGLLELMRMRALRLAHVRVDLKLFEVDWAQQLSRAALEAAALSAKLEAAVFVTDEAEAELQALREALDSTGAPGKLAVARWLIFHRDEKVTSARWLELARDALTDFDEAAQFGVGTNHYFTELNRNRPAPDALAAADFVCYSLNPQVHATDEASLVEALAPQGETVRSARQFIGGLPISVSPITLKPRFDPHQPPEGVGTSPWPTGVDGRQATPFVAAWLVGSLKYLAESGVQSATYFETIGWRGVMESAAGPVRPDLFPSQPGMVFPTWQVLADVAEFVDGDVCTTTSSDPLKVVCLALRRGATTRLLIANVSGEPQTVLLAGVNGAVSARRLSEATLVEAVLSPEAFRQQCESLTADGEELTLDLDTDEIITLDHAI